jgi:hypothetical protein
MMCQWHSIDVFTPLQSTNGAPPWCHTSHQGGVSSFRRKGWSLIPIWLGLPQRSDTATEFTSMSLCCLSIINNGWMINVVLTKILEYCHIAQIMTRIILQDCRSMFFRLSVTLALFFKLWAINRQMKSQYLSSGCKQSSRQDCCKILVRQCRCDGWSHGWHQSLIKLEDSSNDCCGRNGYKWLSFLQTHIKRLVQPVEVKLIVLN